MPKHAFSIETLSIEQIRILYEERLRADFPPDELKPLAMIERGFRYGTYICLGAVDAGGEILAYAFFVLLKGANERCALVDYYAVRQDLRDTGIGSRFLRAMIEGKLREIDCVLLEVDYPDDALDEAERIMRLRRLGFYMRNGLRDTSVRAKVFGVRFRILALPVGKVVSPEETLRIYAALYRSILDEKRYTENVRVMIDPKQTEV